MDNYIFEKNWIIEKPLTIIQSGYIEIFVDYRTVTVSEKEITLTAKEFDVLALLMMNPKRVLTYEMISDIVWQEVYDIYTRKTITSHICTLRKKLGTSIAVAIKSVYNIGYKFDGDVNIIKRTIVNPHI